MNSSECGNGLIDYGEECDGGLGCNNSSCLCMGSNGFQPASPPNTSCTFSSISLVVFWFSITTFTSLQALLHRPHILILVNFVTKAVSIVSASNVYSALIPANVLKNESSMNVKVI
jgi:hypothetical protein